MRVFGIDFSSAPSRRKPIVCVSARLAADTLLIEHYLELVSLSEFETFLTEPGPWIAGFDFPFGQPRKLIEQLTWPTSWPDYVHQISAMGQDYFEDSIARYRQSRPPGDKHHLRFTDTLAKSVSPMMLHGVPVGKMFFQGAPRLLKAGVRVLPCHPIDDPRVSLEAYPALVARKWLGRRSYKSDQLKKQTIEKEVARRELVLALQSNQLSSHYGLSLGLSDDLAGQLVEDAKADRLDATLCALQAAWAYTHRLRGYGIPGDCDPLEGWIVDPELL